jgi:transposase
MLDKVIFVTPTRERKVIGEFKADLEAHGGKAANVFSFSADLHKPYRTGIQEHSPNATLTLDRYHVVQFLNRAVDEVRRREQRTAPGLKRSRYSWLKKPSKLTAGQREHLLYLRGRYRQTGRAYELKLQFDDMWSLPADMAPGYLVAWCSEVQRSGLEPLQAFANTIDEHRYLLLRWFRTHISIGVLEAINGLVQAAKRRARGYRTDRHYIAMIYMTAGKLNFGLPT